MGYADMHCHIMPGVDDGSTDPDMSRNMIGIAIEEGIDTVILTPHYKPERRHADAEQIREYAAVMTQEYANTQFPVKFYPGNEILYFTDCIKELDEGKILTLADSRYVLVEFEPMDDIERITSGVRNLLYAGYHPVLAHIERYACMVEKPDNRRRVTDMGCLVQVNASSIMGDFGYTARLFTRRLLKERAVHFVATDAHSDRRRSPRMEKCARYLYRKCGEEYAERLICGNVREMISGGEIYGT